MTAPLISAVKVECIGSHDIVRVWSRGGLAGELIVSKGDGEWIRARLEAEPSAVTAPVSPWAVPPEPESEDD